MRLVQIRVRMLPPVLSGSTGMMGFICILEFAYAFQRAPLFLGALHLTKEALRNFPN